MESKLSSCKHPWEISSRKHENSVENLKLYWRKNHLVRNFSWSQLNWYVHNSINPIMTSSTGNWSISRVLPVEQLSSSPSWTSWTEFNLRQVYQNSQVQLEMSIFIIPSWTSWTGFNWSVPFSVTEIYFGQLIWYQMKPVQLGSTEILTWDIDC